MVAVTEKFRLEKQLNRFEKRFDFKRNKQKIYKDVFNEIDKPIKKKIVSTIEKGNSPVKGHKRFDEYSQSYKDQITEGRYTRYSKRIRPINLTLSGKLLKSIQSIKTTRGLTISFTDFKAIFHNRLGAGRSRVKRRMIPLGNEEFNAPINRIVTQAMKKVVKNYFSK